MGLRIKILSGFLILAAMLLVAGAWSIYELKNIGQSVQGLLDENYRSISAAKSMTEALERQDSAVLLLLLGKESEGRSILSSADELFSTALGKARDNITISGEENLVAAIEEAYGAYRDQLTRLAHTNDDQSRLTWYFNDGHSSFLAVKSAVADLMDLNDSTMYATARNLEGRAHRATMPGIIAIASAFLFSLLFSFLVNLYVVTPIISITQGIREFLKSGKSFTVQVETEDELSGLAASIHNLIDRLQTMREQK